MTEIQEASITEEFLSKYDPKNAGQLSSQDADAIKEFTDEQLKALAEKYPNKTAGNNYLVLWDKTKADKSQIGQVSTWQTLYQLRVRLKQMQYVAVGFRETYKPSQVAEAQSTIGYVGDITTEELNNAPGVAPITESSRPPIPPFNETNNSIVGANTADGTVAQEQQATETGVADNSPVKEGTAAVAEEQTAQPVVAKKTSAKKATE